MAFTQRATDMAMALLAVLVFALCSSLTGERASLDSELHSLVSVL